MLCYCVFEGADEEMTRNMEGKQEPSESSFMALLQNATRASPSFIFRLFAQKP